MHYLSPGLNLLDKDSVRKHIFHRTYMYAIPGYHRYSKEYNKTVGHLSTGDARLDMAYMNEYVNVGGSIADILRLFEQGADIRMQNAKDLVEIYEVLVAHIGFWLRFIESDPNVRDAPIDSLSLMAEFAESIRDRAVGFKADLPEPPNLSNIRRIFGVGSGMELLFSESSIRDNSAIEAPPLVGRIEELLEKRKNPGKNNGRRTPF